MNYSAAFALYAALTLTAPPTLAASASFADAVSQGTAGSLTLRASFTPASADVGQAISIYVVAALPSGGASVLYANTSSGWTPVTGSLPKFQAGTSASSSISLDILQNVDVRSLSGAQIYIGYGLDSTGSAYDDMLRNQRYRLVHTVSASTTTKPGGPSAAAACPSDTATPLFGTSPVALEDFIAFRPLGFMSTPIHMFPAKHSAFSMTPIGQTAVPKPVRAPGKMLVTEIYEASFSTGGKNYQVFMYPCREVRTYFGHLVTISDRLKAEFDKAAPNCNSFNDGSSTVTTCRRENLALELAEGEVFGTGPDSAGVDFGTTDFRRNPAAFINLAHYDSYYPYYVSPLEFFSSTVRTALEAKTGHIFGSRPRTAAPIGGTHMQDLAGTAQGNWFLPGKNHSNTTDLSIFLGLAHDYVDPTQPLMAAGVSIQGMSLGLYSYTVNSSGQINRDFSAVKPDGTIYCFDNFATGQSAGGLPLTTPKGIVLMKMPNEASLQVELQAAASCSAGPLALTANATTFER